MALTCPPPSKLSKRIMGAPAMICLGSAVLVDLRVRGFVPTLTTRSTASWKPARQTFPERDATAAEPSLLLPTGVAVVALLSSFASSRQRCCKKASKVVLQAIGSVETKRFLGDWADMAPSLSSSSSSEKREVTCVDLPGGIKQIRGIYAEDNQRYGEEYDLKAGSTDNAYLLKQGEDQWMLIGIFDEAFVESLVRELGAETIAKIKYLVVQFFDGKQTAALETFLRARPAGSLPIKLFLSNPIAVTLRKVMDPDLLESVELEVIKNGSVLEMSDSRFLRFMLAPTPKLPEASVLFDPLTGTLFSGKFFSAHRALKTQDSPFDSAGQQGWEDYAEDWFHVFDCYFFTQTAQRAIRRIFMLADALVGPDVQQLATLHGPVVLENCWKLMAKYEAWTEVKLRSERKDAEVLVMFASAYGHTKALADAIVKGLKISSCRTNLMDLEHASGEQVAAALESCDAFVLGSPTLGGEMPTQVKEALGVLLGAASSEEKQLVPCGVFGSYGWSGEAVDELYFRLKDGGFPFAFDPIRVRFRPTDKDLELCIEAGERMAQRLQRARREKRSRRVRAMESLATLGNAAEAMGKMRTSQCLLSTKQGEEDIVAPVSWVNQASFDPPGLTLSVPKQDQNPLAQLSLEEQLNTLLEKYDADQSGSLDKEEVTTMARDLLGVASEEDLAIKGGEIDEIVKTLIHEEGGTITREELRAAVQDGPFAPLLEKEKQLLSLQSQLGCVPTGIEIREAGAEAAFVLNLIPEGVEVERVNMQRHKKAKSQIGALVVQESHAYVECSVTQALDAGDHLLLYARVVGGQVLEDNELTQMTTVTKAKRSGRVKQVAMAAGRSLDGAAAQPGAFTGRSLPVWPRGCKVVCRSVGMRSRGGEVQESEVKMWEGLTPGKKYRLQTFVSEVAEDTTTIRSMDFDRDRFDIEFQLTNGTTYNSYIVRGDKTALVDTSHEKFGELYFETLDKHLDYAKLDYLIVSHTEPDHSGLIPQVLERAAAKGNDHLQVVGSKVCIQFLENLCFAPFKQKIVANGAKLDLGRGHELQFVIAPNLHWPDTMFTFDAGTQILYTCDAFGMHYCSQHIVDAEGVRSLLPHYALYYDCLMKPNARSVLTALKKIADLPYHTIATGHGPMLKENTSEFVELYKGWSAQAMEKLGPSVAIFWVSNYGQSERLSQLFAHGVTSAGAAVEMHDLNAVDVHELTECLSRNEVLAVMTPPQGSDHAAGSALASLISSAKAKKHRFVVLESCSADQEPAEIVRQRFAAQDVTEVMPSMKIPEHTLTPQIMQGYEELGMVLGRKVTQKGKQAAQKKQGKDLQRALGRLSSSLYVVTAAKAGLRHAMIASWVTPASRNPLGISLTIAKDRAMEPLLRTGDKFNLNFLEEGKSLSMMKHFLKRFPPGADRLAGIDAFPSENGAAVLREACAFLECVVVSRMDASDHWVAYAHVTGGNVSRPEATTAVHHRKVASYY